MPLLAKWEKDRFDSVPGLPRTLRTSLDSPSISEERRVALLALLAYDPSSEMFVAREAVNALRDIKTVTGEHLLRQLVRAGIELDFGQISVAHKKIVAQSLNLGTPAYATRFMNILRGDLDEVLQIAEYIVIPTEWISDDTALRRELIHWIPRLHVSDGSFAGLAIDAVHHALRDDWVTLDKDLQTSAITLISRADSERRSMPSSSRTTTRRFVKRAKFSHGRLRTRDLSRRS